MKLKFNLFIVFAFMFCMNGFSQEPAKTQKVIYKISADEVKPAVTSAEAKRITPEKKPIESCEINASKKEAIVTTKSPDGTISKEKFEIKENK